MDFLSRLIAGTGSSPTKQRTNTPAERLATCKKVCTALQQIWRNGSSLSEDEADTIAVANCLRKLNGLLHEESRKAAPHSCLLLAASTQIYIIIAKLALQAQNAEITQSAAQFFHILIHSEAEGVLDSKIFARSLIDLAKRGTTYAPNGEEEAALVERLFEISTKIKLDPDILPAWFYPERDKSRTGEGSSGIAQARMNQFPLFYLLVQFVHHDGPTGDFARLGLLYLIETAVKSKPLERWMIESDLAPQMASGLGALYSRLSRSLPWSLQGDVPLIIAYSDAGPDEEKTEQHSDFQQENKAFLSYLAFWQDTLNHCSSQEVTDTLLDHFQVLFVQQLLYPSLLESSDVDGGSTASVIMHLFRILNALEHPALVDRTLKYLLATQERTDEPRKRPRMSISRRKSMDQLAAMVTSEAPPPDLFNLLDLVVMGLKSQSSRTISATLKLLCVIISKHHLHVIETLPRSVPESPSSLPQVWPVEAMNRELTKLIFLGTEIGEKGASIDLSYQSLLNDVQLTLETHSCHTEFGTDGTESPRGIQGCKICEELVELFKTFFANDTMVNIALTEAVVAIASCSRLSLQPWLFSMDSAAQENILSVISTHIEQVREWKKQFSDWDRLLALRRSELMMESIEAAGSRSASGTSRATHVSNTVSPSTIQVRRSEGSPPSSRPTTPRGRKIKSEPFGSIDSTLSTSPPLRPPKRNSALASSPLRQSVLPASADSVKESDGPTTDEASKLSDQALLATQVHLPNNDEQDPMQPAFASLAERLKNAEISKPDASGTLSVTSSGVATPNLQGGEGFRRTSVSLSHVLTNAVILQEFILEIAAVVQVRASVLGEVEA